MKNKKYLLLFLLILMFCFISPAQAGDKPKTIKYQVQVKIGDFKGEIPIGPDSIGKYIKSVYAYAVAIVGILATVVLMFGGIIWMTSGGNAERAGNAKAWIGASLSGLVLVLSSHLILSYVNPCLVSFKPIDLAPINDTAKGCCNHGAYNVLQATDTTRDKCDEMGGNFKPGLIKDGNKCVTPPKECRFICILVCPSGQIPVVENKCKGKEKPPCSILAQCCCDI